MSQDETGAARTRSAGGNYFAVCSAAIDEIMDVIGLHGVLAFLSLARGSGADQRTTGWGVKAIEQRGILGRRSAQKALSMLQKEGFVGARGQRHRRKLREPVGIDCDADGKVTFAPRIWLPNSLVDGIEGRKSPLALLREAGSLDAVRLLLAIYPQCELPTVFGLPIELMRVEWPLKRLDNRREYSIWGVGNGTWHVADRFASEVLPDVVVEDDASRTKARRRLLAARSILMKLKLLVEVPYVFVGAPGDEEPYCPAGWSGETAER